MPFYEAHTQSAALLQRLNTEAGLLVVCYCAAWCDTCKRYRQDFEALAAQWPAHTFVWIDIEESPELLEENDIENFPTVLIQSPAGNQFFGPLLPYISHLEKLIARSGATTSLIDAGPGALRDLLASAAQQDTH
jgi:thiol-disulfide isomerase/thioredoxin